MPTDTPHSITDEDGNPMRWAKKPWVHVGQYTREEAVQMLGERMVSQKRRMLMKDCVRIIYYCQVQRSSGCRYEMSVCVPLNKDEKLRIDDYNKHTCDVDAARLRRRTLPQMEDFDRPIEKRVRPRGMGGPVKGTDLLGEDTYEDGDEFGVVHLENSSTTDVSLNSLLANAYATHETSAEPETSVWTTVDIDVVDLTKKPDGPFNFVLNCSDQGTRFSYAYPIVNNQGDVVAKALLDMLYIFGQPAALHMEAFYQNSVLPNILLSKFPTLNLTYYSLKRNHLGQLVPRREAQQMKDRLFAWMVETGAASWVQELCAMKFSHNSEWIEEIGGTPMDLFYRRNKPHTNALKEDLISQVKVELQSED